MECAGCDHTIWWDGNITVYARSNWVVVIPREFGLIEIGFDFDVTPTMNAEQISGAPFTSRAIFSCYADLRAVLATAAIVIVIKTVDIVYTLFIPDAVETVHSAANTIIIINGKCSLSSDIDDTSVEIIGYVIIGCVVNLIGDKYALVDEINSA